MDEKLTVEEANAVCGAPLRLELAGIPKSVSEASTKNPSSATVGIERNGFKQALGTYSGIAFLGGAALGLGGYLYALDKHNDPNPGSAKPISYALAITGDVGMGTGLLAYIVAAFLPDYHEVSVNAAPVPGGFAGSVGGHF